MLLRRQRQTAVGWIFGEPSLPESPANYIPPADPLGPSFKLNYIDEVLSNRKQPEGLGAAGVQDYYSPQDDLFNVVLAPDIAGEAGRAKDPTTRPSRRAGSTVAPNDSRVACRDSTLDER